ncbi:AB hydrolase superfamily protein [Lachnellula suecica]|uniref:AB hydrolase superfamily protein n=1 Tax=Lachnellula suecica TaxID=602035 RepID=A0A8T9C282_9HELO|nr:AB hydrolase superfamily protein [Lachnellula suecica]
MSTLQSLRTDDNITIKYIDTGVNGDQEALKPLLILLHGFTGSSAVWKRNIPGLAKKYRVIAPDLRGHGESDKPGHGYHVMRLAMDLHRLVKSIVAPTAKDAHDDGEVETKQWKAIGGSLGCAILWAYASLFTTQPFSHIILIDQSPLQNSDLSGWDSRFCNRGMNSAPAVSALQATLALSPVTAHKGTIAACFSYRSHPQSSDTVSAEEAASDEAFFLGEAVKGDAWWYGKLMADHTALDWRDSIRASFGKGSGSSTKVLVMASSRSGCFPAAGPMAVVGLVNEGCEEQEKKAQGVVVDWGGHWLYWENPARFAKIALAFLADGEVVDA